MGGWVDRLEMEAVGIQQTQYVMGVILSLELVGSGMVRLCHPNHTLL